MCGFAPTLAWLGGAVGEAARRFARTLALALLGLSVAANALGHGLEAFRLAPAWWVVVIVSAVAPAVLGAVVHLAVLVGRAEPDGPEAAEPIGYALAREAYDGGVLDDDGLSHRWHDAPPAGEFDRAAALIAVGAGRHRLSRELDITEYEARRLLARARITPPDPIPHDISPAAPGAPVLNGVPS